MYIRTTVWLVGLYIDRCITISWQTPAVFDLDGNCQHLRRRTLRCLCEMKVNGSALMYYG